MEKKSPWSKMKKSSSSQLAEAYEDSEKEKSKYKNEIREELEEKTPYDSYKKSSLKDEDEIIIIRRPRRE